METQQITAHQVTRQLRRLITGSPLAAEVTGRVYYDGSRPRDSRAEDIVITYTEGTAGRQIQEGTVTVTVFFADLDPWADGVTVEDGERAEQLEALAQQWADSLTAGLTGPYLFRLKEAIHTAPEPETREHFVTVRLSFRHCSG